jgi:hypothetical protein
MLQWPGKKVGVEMNMCGSDCRAGAGRLGLRVLLLAVLFSFPWRAGLADGGASGECDIQVDLRMSVYMVMVEGEAYRGKRYLTWDDALKLRDVLVSAGACERASRPKPCKLELASAGNYVVLRDGVNFDPYIKLRTLGAARKYARRLERVKLCKPIG